jgi:KaiC/GvpD/RAD55 family RecA-like ATPase
MISQYIQAKIKNLVALLGKPFARRAEDGRKKQDSEDPIPAVNNPDKTKTPQISREMISQYISTGIKELDALLGKGSPHDTDERGNRRGEDAPPGKGSAHDTDDHGIRRGSVVVIRGEPGSGKTTLALQVLSVYLKNKTNKAVLFSLEENSKDLLERMDRNFNFELANKTTKSDQQDCQLYCLDAKILFKHIEDILKDYSREVQDALTDAAGTWSPGPVFAYFIKHFIKKLKEDQESKAWFKLLGEGKFLIMIDSIDAFMGALSHEGMEAQSRILLKAICDLLRGESADPKPDAANTVILTSEYHFHAASPTPAFTESFFCDVEILLRPEPVCVPVDYEYNIQAPVGYNFNALIREDAKSIESRSFCRVLKSRATANQSRRCAYDIVATKGVQFFETYPGDGKIILFAENQPQRTAWNSFFQHDVPDSYPALRHEVFDRMSMQTVYEGQRRLRNMPLKTDMYLSSFDSYWVGWYRSFKLKWDLHNALELFLKPKPELHEQYCRFVNSLVRALRTVIPNMKGVPLNTNERQKFAKLVEDKIKEETYLSKFEKLLEPKYSSGKVENLIMDIFKSSTPFARDYSCFLQLIPFRELKLFGEIRSGILPELIKPRESFRGKKWIKKAEEYCGGKSETSEVRKTNNITRSVGNPDQLPIEWLSIPYDANIGFFVYRKDILHGSRKQFGREKVEARLNELVDREKKLMDKLFEQITSEKKSEHDDDPRITPGKHILVDELRKKLPFCGNDEINKDKRDLYEKCVKKVIKWAADRILEGEEPKTWEEVIVLCELLNKKLLIETQTFGSYMCTLLEMIWNSGGELKVQPDYVIEKKHKLYVPLLRALHLLDSLFDSKIVDRNSSVAPQLSAGRDKSGEDNWLFARHWYSTLANYLTAKDESERYLAKASPGAALEIMPIPVSLSRWVDDLYFDEKGNRDLALKCPKSYQFMRKCFPQNQNSGAETDDVPRCPNLTNETINCNNDDFRHLLNGPLHHSCWGDWSFGLLAGSENRTLAIDLINNMMASIKIISRAFAGACVPTVTEFYEMFGDIPCVYLPERRDITMPNLTYEELRQNFFKHAKTTNEIYDFMHCAKILHGQVEFLRRTKDPEKKAKKRSEDLVKRCIRIIENIESLYNESILISPQYRQGAIVS